MQFLNLLRVSFLIWVEIFYDIFQRTIFRTCEHCCWYFRSKWSNSLLVRTNVIVLIIHYSFAANNPSPEKSRNWLDFFIDIFVEFPLRAHQSFTGIFYLWKIRRCIICKNLFVLVYYCLYFAFSTVNEVANEFPFFAINSLNFFDTVDRPVKQFGD